MLGCKRYRKSVKMCLIGLGDIDASKSEDWSPFDCIQGVVTESKQRRSNVQRYAVQPIDFDDEMLSSPLACYRET